ncbi:PAS domain-containing protein, partial [Haematococcus lacustris]
VEIASRCCRHWVDEDTLEPDGVVLAERIISAGKLLMPHQPYMVIWYSSFLIDVQGSYQSGYAELQYAKKAPNPSLLERFCIFVRDQEHAQKSSAASSGDNASVDLVSYVEFQRNYRLAVKLHTDALLAKRTFWETLLHANVTFDKLSNAVARIESTVRASDRMYKQVLSRHSNSVKVLQLYVKFLQGVRSDPWSAARWAAEAEKLQKLEEEANERAVFGGGPQGNSLHNHDDSKGVIIMGANCLVRMINDVACGILGYTNKQEILGKNINVIVPPPFSRNHNNYVRNYIQTGKAKILDQLREFVALHKDRYVKPISVFVTKVSGIGEDSVFMGVFAEIVSPHNVAIVWVMGGGQVLSCDGTFTDWLGYKQEDLHGKPVTDLVLQRQELEQTLMQMRHFYLDEVVQVDAEIKVGGINETALYVLTMRRSTDASQKLMVTDSRGRILHVTKHLATDLNTTVSKLQGGGAAHALDALLPQPFMRIHHQVLDERRLSLVLNSKGLVLQAGDSTSSLFGFEPTALVGAHLAYVVDVLRPSAGDGTGIVSMLDDELRAGQVLMHMAERSYANPGASWRVGVSPIMDPVQLAALGPMGMAMMAKKTVPAVMTVEAHLEQPFLDGARVQLPPELLLK